MRLYLDTCCLNRPFDDLSQERVAREAEAVTTLLESVARGEHALVRSAQHDAEVEDTPDPVRRAALRRVLSLEAAPVALTVAALRRAEELVHLGFSLKDAQHLACAEQARAGVFLTVDDRLLRRARRYSARISVPVDDPIGWGKRQP